MAGGVGAGMCGAKAPPFFEFFPSNHFQHVKCVEKKGKIQSKGNPLARHEARDWLRSWRANDELRGLSGLVFLHRPFSISTVFR